MMDVDTINIINAENYHQEREERALKNRILSISNTDKKQKLWREHFPPIKNSDTNLIF